MKVWSFKLNKRTVVFALIALLAVIAVVLIATTAGSAMPDAGSESVSAPESADGSSEEQRLAFIRQYGWEVDGDSVEMLKLYIPQEFDSVLNRYNAIQKRQGFDLEKYRGKRVERYSYVITNYPANAHPVYINLIVCDGKIIGGDVSSKELGGFMHGFSPERVSVETVSEDAAQTDAGAEVSPEDADDWQEK